MVNNFPLYVIPAKAGIYINRFRVPPTLAVRLYELFVHGSRSAIRRAGKHGMTKLTFALALVIILSIFLSFPTPVLAKRKLPSWKPASTAKSTTSGVTVKVKFRSDRKGVILNFANLTAASGVSYDLVYDTRGTTQNAGGAVKISSDTANTEVIFGTCSAGVCRYDSSISNAKLQVFITLKNGRKIVKPFRLKV